MFQFLIGKVKLAISEQNSIIKSKFQFLIGKVKPGHYWNAEDAKHVSIPHR